MHNENILKIYYRIYREGHGQIMPPCPVIHKDLVRPYLNDELRTIFDEFYRLNPTVEYFMLDGSHKTTAATLTDNKIEVMIFDSEQDIQKAKGLAERGELFNYHLKHSIEGILDDLIDHFGKSKKFETIEQKTRRMIKEKVIPQYMIDHYHEYSPKAI